MTLSDYSIFVLSDYLHQQILFSVVDSIKASILHDLGGMAGEW
jgi:hypothetical protein